MQGQYNTRSPAVKRLMREAQELAEPTYDYFAQPLSDNLFEWHFTVRGPVDTEFDGGIYHGRIVLPPDYPMKPPNIIVLTPNGRFETGKKICLSISGHHPESWQPSWSIRTALLAIIGFMPTPSQGTIGSLDYPADERKKLAKKSLTFSCSDCGSTVHLLKKEILADEEKKVLLDEAKEVIKKMSIKGENVKTNETVKTEEEETEAEKYKRARKLYAIRMRAKIKKRLLDQSGEPEPTPEPQVVRQRVPEQPQVQPQPAVVQPQRPAAVQAESTHSVFYDIIIAVIVLIIAVLLFRRFSLHSSPDAASTASPEPPVDAADLL